METIYGKEQIVQVVKQNIQNMFQTITTDPLFERVTYKWDRERCIALANGDDQLEVSDYTGLSFEFKYGDDAPVSKVSVSLKLKINIDWELSSDGNRYATYTLIPKMGWSSSCDMTPEETTKTLAIYTEVNDLMQRCYVAGGLDKVKVVYMTKTEIEEAAAKRKLELEASAYKDCVSRVLEAVRSNMRVGKEKAIPTTMIALERPNHVESKLSFDFGPKSFSVEIGRNTTYIKRTR